MAGNWAITATDRRQEAFNLIQLEPQPRILLSDKRTIELYDHGFFAGSRKNQLQFFSPQLKPISISFENAAQLPDLHLAIRLYEIRRIREQHKAHFDPNKYAQVKTENVFPLQVSQVKNIRDNYNNNPLPNRIIMRTSTRRPGPEAVMIDLYGKVISGLNYTAITYHEEGLIHVYSRDTIDGVAKVVTGLIDLDGQVQIPLDYEKIPSVTQDHVIVQQYGLFGVVSRKNEEMIPIKYEQIRFVSGYFLLSRFGKWGIALPDGQIITDPQYDEIKVLEEEGAGFEAKRNGKTIFLDPSGQAFGKN